MLDHSDLIYIQNVLKRTSIHQISEAEKIILSKKNLYNYNNDQFLMAQMFAASYRALIQCLLADPSEESYKLVQRFYAHKDIQDLCRLLEKYDSKNTIESYRYYTQAMIIVNKNHALFEQIFLIVRPHILEKRPREINQKTNDFTFEDLDENGYTGTSDVQTRNTKL